MTVMMMNDFDEYFPKKKQMSNFLEENPIISYQT
jgi:hypothetical protein